MTSERTTHSAQLGPLAGRLAGTLALVVGGMALVGWTFHIAVLKSIRPDWVSMKPNTALCFVLVGLALLLSRPSSAFRLQSSALVSRLSRLCTLLVGLIGLLSLCEYAFGWNPGFDQWLFTEPAGAVGTSNPGRMAPDTALCFVLFAVGFEFARGSRQAMGRLITSATLGALVVTIALAEILSYFTPTLRTYGWGGLTMMALPTATLFAALGAALVLIALPKNRPDSAAPTTALAAPGAQASWLFLLIFVLLAVGIVATGIFYYRNYERQFRTEAEQQLTAIAELKVGELSQWRKERLGDATTLHYNPALTQLVRRFFASPADADAQRQLQVWLGKYQTQGPYDWVFVLDAQGGVRLSLPETAVPVAAVLSARAREVLRSDQPAFQDFYLHELSQRVYLALLIPIRDETDANRPLGVLILRIDPATYLYPFIRRWPVPSATAETLLVRREGNEAVFLNELRFQTNTALTLRLSLANTTIPAVKAALGQEGIAAGVDYRGASVLAALHAVPDSPWFLVARRDFAEVFAPLRARLWQVVTMVGILLFGAGAGVGLVWRQQHIRFYRDRAEVSEAMKQEQALSNAIIESIPGTFYMLDETGKYVRWSAYQRDEIVGKPDNEVAQTSAIDTIHPDDRAIVGSRIENVLKNGVAETVEGRVLLRGGPAFRWLLMTGRRMMFNDRPFLISIGIDITERKQAEVALAETKALLQAALDHSQAGIAIADAPSGRLLYVNKAGLLIGGETEGKLVAGVEVNQYVASWKLLNLDRTPLAKEEVPLARAVLFGEQCTREFIIRRSEHDDRIVLANAAPIRNLAGAVTAGIVVFLDITEHKRAEELLRQNTEELRARNQELTRFNRLMAGRELRTIELKQQVNDLAAQLGQSRPYPLAFLDAAAAEVVRTTPKPNDQGAEVRGQKSEVSDQKSEVSKTQKEKSP